MRTNEREGLTAIEKPEESREVRYVQLRNFISVAPHIQENVTAREERKIIISG